MKKLKEPGNPESMMEWGFKINELIQWAENIDITLAKMGEPKEEDLEVQLPESTRFYQTTFPTKPKNDKCENCLISLTCPVHGVKSEPKEDKCLHCEERWSKVGALDIDCIDGHNHCFTKPTPSDVWEEFDKLWHSDTDEGGWCIEGTPSREYKPIKDFIRTNFVAKDEIREHIANRRTILSEMVKKWDYDIDKHRLNELEQVESLLNEEEI